jgi:shikimate dehydrogenase
MADHPKITAHTKLICIIGHPLEHTLSPLMHNALFQDLKLDYTYLAFDVHSHNLKAAFDGIRALNIEGANITIPHKQMSLKYMDELDPLVREIGALNTVKNENGKLIGRNTDALGAKKALDDAKFDLRRKSVIVLGAGGASRAICYAIKEEIEELMIINRTYSKAKELAMELEKNSELNIKTFDLRDSSIVNLIQSADILINTTPIGMFPDVGKSPVPKQALIEHLNVFDVIYNPLETQLLKDAADKGCKTLGGIDMLINQGALAFEWWTSKKPNTKLMKKKLIKFVEDKNC